MENWEEMILEPVDSGIIRPEDISADDWEWARENLTRD